MPANGPSLSLVPFSSVHAPGAGVHARTSRLTARAGSLQRTRASSEVIFGARLTPSGGCGRAVSSPDSMPSMVAISSSAPDAASLASRSPAVSDGLIGSVTTPKTGPASSSATIRNVLAPVTSSPRRMACCTGAAPRQAGSKEKCRLTQPSRGMSRARCGISAPYAVTGQQSAAISPSRVRKSASPGLAGLSTSMPADRARSATGLGATCKPRPAGASGRVTTAATSCLDFSKPSSEGTAAAGVPAKTSRIRSVRLPAHRVRRGLHHGDRLAPPFGGPDLLHGELALRRVEAVDEQNSVQVVGLVLHAARELPGSLQSDRLAVHVEAHGHRAVRPPRRVLQAGKRQAPLVVRLLLLGQHEGRIDQVAQLIINMEGEDPEPHPDLRCGQAHARRVLHRLGQVLDQPAQLRIEVTHRLGRRAQHRIAEQPYRLDAHQVPPEIDRVLLARQVYGAGRRRPADGERALNAALRAARATAGSGWCSLSAVSRSVTPG